MNTVLTFFSALRSKAVQFIAALLVVLAVLLKLRAGVREDATEDAIQEMEKRDAQRADDIRDRVDAVPSVMRVDPTDNRGYRD